MVPPMRTLFLVAGLWLGCIPAAMAWQDASEVLPYRVSWGPLSIGKAWLEYQPAPNGYAVQAKVKDSSMWIDLEDVWRAEGVQPGWQSRFYTAKQKENDYRADKRITFKPNPGKAVYQNLLGGEADIEVKLPPGTRDILSSLYALRAGGLEALKKPRTMQVMGLKKVFPLDVKAAVKEPATKTMPAVWRVEMLAHGGSVNKPRTDRWTVWLSDTPQLVPVKIQASVKLGTFTAVLNK
jgi:hypothetical protein